MMTYENLTNEYSDILNIKEKRLHSSYGRIKGNKIAISTNILTTQKKCVLAEEIGHYYTASSDIINQKNIRNIKLEAKGRIWAYNKLIGIQALINAYEARCTTLYDMADYLDVTVEFLQEAINYYKRKCGVCTHLGSYVIIFEPHLAIFKHIE